MANLFSCEGMEDGDEIDAMLTQVQLEIVAIFTRAFF
jgi:hypothetical protein